MLQVTDTPGKTLIFCNRMLACALLVKKKKIIKLKLLFLFVKSNNEAPNSILWAAIGTSARAT